jgi:hypothetical protein
VSTVADGQGQAVQGATVIANSSDGSSTRTAITGASGQYRIPGLDSGQYFISREASSVGSPGQTVASYLGHPGLTVNWSVAPRTTPIAIAHPGIQPASASDLNAAKLAVSGKDDPPPGCKGMPGPPCGAEKVRETPRRLTARQSN